MTSNQGLSMYVPEQHTPAPSASDECRSVLDVRAIFVMAVEMKKPTSAEMNKKRNERLMFGDISKT